MTRVCIDIDQDGGNGPVPLVKTYSTVIGDGAQVDFPIDHNLGHRAVMLQAVDVNTGALRNDTDVVFNSDNRATVRFDTAPANQAIRIDALSVRPGTATV